MTPSDQTLKWQLVLLTAAFALVGFVLELGPVGGVFSLINGGRPIADGASIELQALGFLAYLALAASAIVGLHPNEDEPTPKEPPPGEPALKSANENETAGEQVRVRPELQQMRMIFTALGGYTLLKVISLMLMTHLGLNPAARLPLFNFGFFYTALGWLVLWQFLRWYAQRRRWVRLQAELVGADITPIVGVVIILEPLFFLISLASGRLHGSGTLLLLTGLLQLTILIAAAFLWFARPLTLKRTVTSLLICGGVIVVLTVMMAIIERSITGG